MTIANAIQISQSIMRSSSVSASCDEVLGVDGGVAAEGTLGGVTLQTVAQLDITGTGGDGATVIVGVGRKEIVTRAAATVAAVNTIGTHKRASFRLGDAIQISQSIMCFGNSDPTLNPIRCKQLFS